MVNSAVQKAAENGPEQAQKAELMRALGARSVVLVGMMGAGKSSIGRRLAIGWTMGTVVSALGVYFSLKLDLPTGATIVCTFGAVLVVMFLVHLLFFHGREARVLAGASSLPNPKERVLQGQR